jgi:hypothetical protein
VSRLRAGADRVRREEGEGTTPVRAVLRQMEADAADEVPDRVERVQPALDRSVVAGDGGAEGVAELGPPAASAAPSTYSAPGMGGTASASRARSGSGGARTIRSRRARARGSRRAG